MGDVFDLIEHINEEPPAYRILGWLHPKKNPSRSRIAKGNASLQDADTREMAKALGGAQPVPESARERARWMKEELARLNQTKKK